MRKIETLEQLQAEQRRLHGLAKEMEVGMQEELDYFSHSIQSITSIFDKFKKGSTLVAGSLGVILPLLLSKQKGGGFGKGVPGPPWLAIATTVGGFLMNSEIGQKLVDKLKGWVGSIMRKKGDEKDEMPEEESTQPNC